ncbi:hypothetical protein GCM10022223_55990 [Kineosporia mesophila]|uniref:Uncharacterized protein n=1 Tax=Kineosporia mesophila TaxID=566012 RepID=A0ABP7AEZ2_9ACTN|nr:hypothetical protein [Kineosporia mesophila]MCD5352899.1 hypothetical protein [Kineosporia mesophila]
MTAQPETPQPVVTVPRPVLPDTTGKSGPGTVSPGRGTPMISESVPDDVEAEAAHRYGLALPDLAEVRAALSNVYGDKADDLWADLLRRCGLRGHETSRDALQKLLQTMKSQDPVMALCARALSIRLDTYDHLTAAYHIVRSAS